MPPVHTYRAYVPSRYEHGFVACDGILDDGDGVPENDDSFRCRKTAESAISALLTSPAPEEDADPFGSFDDVMFLQSAAFGSIVDVDDAYILSQLVLPSSAARRRVADEL